MSSKAQTAKAAATKQETTKPIVRRKIVDIATKRKVTEPKPKASTISPVKLPDGGPLLPKGEELELSGDTVTAVVPKAYLLRLTHHHVIEVRQGTQSMPREYAEHWWSKANGVTIFKPAKA